MKKLLGDESRNDDRRDAAVHWILAGAEGKSADEREAFLEKACGGDDALRQRIERTLEENEVEENIGLEAANELPRKMGEYEIVRAISRGAMGEVYLARDPQLRREVALKRLPLGDLASAETIRRFQQEMQAVAQLSHSNIETAFHALDVDGQQVLVMEYVDGRDLENIIREEGTMDSGAAIDLILQAARGLQHAHEAGGVHRDIKPANLLLNRSGVLKVLDMGLARMEAITFSRLAGACYSAFVSSLRIAAWLSSDSFSKG